MTPMRVDFPFLVSDCDRHGNTRFYVRRHGRKIRIRQKLGTERFALAYADALRTLDQEIGAAQVVNAAPAGTFGWLAACYFASTEFKALDPASQTRRRLCIESCLREPRKPGSRDLMRDCPISALSPAHVKVLRDRKAEQPGAANNRRKYLSSMFGWAVEHNLMRLNPARDVRKVKYASDGFPTWTVAEVCQYEVRHPIGTKARLALALLLYLGVRRGDVVKLGRQHEKDGWLRFVPSKTGYQRKRMSEKPILPILADIIAQSPTGDLTYLVTSYGKPFTPAGFGNWFRRAVQRGRAFPSHRARAAQGGRDHCSGKRRYRSAAYGFV